MDKGTSKNLREELHETFSDAYIENAGLLIHNLAEVYYNMNNLAGKVYFNDNIFEYCLIDILIDLARLKHFHDIDFVNYEKLMAYTGTLFTTEPITAGEMSKAASTVKPA